MLEGQYFRSMHFRRPGGVLFEIATDVPGSGVDEPVDALGNKVEAAASLARAEATGH
jgi:glyoxalase family protein